MYVLTYVLVYVEMYLCMHKHAKVNLVEWAFYESLQKAIRRRLFPPISTYGLCVCVSCGCFVYVRACVSVHTLRISAAKIIDMLASIVFRS